MVPPHSARWLPPAALACLLLGMAAAACLTWAGLVFLCLALPSAYLKLWTVCGPPHQFCTACTSMGGQEKTLQDMQVAHPFSAIPDLLTPQPHFPVTLVGDS